MIRAAKVYRREKVGSRQRNGGVKVILQDSTNIESTKWYQRGHYKDKEEYDFCSQD